MSIKDFEEYIKLGIVKKQSPDIQRALSLTKEAEEKKIFLDISLKNISEENMNYNFIVDSCYDILMELIRAKMFIKGYNASNSHEAEVSYLEIMGFSQNEIRFMDELRYYRNKIKYYGQRLNKEYAEKVLNFMNEIYKKIKA